MAASLGVLLGVSVNTVLAQDKTMSYTAQDNADEAMNERDQATDSDQSDASTLENRKESIQIKLDNTPSNQLKWDKTTSNQFKWNSTQSNQFKWDNTQSDQLKLDSANAINKKIEGLPLLSLRA